jgi:hypothetical protein
MQERHDVRDMAGTVWHQEPRKDEERRDAGRARTAKME